jgi:hypothetical protein
VDALHRVEPYGVLCQFRHDQSKARIMVWHKGFHGLTLFCLSILVHSSTIQDNSQLIWHSLHLIIWECNRSLNNVRQISRFSRQCHLLCGYIMNTPGSATWRRYGTYIMKTSPPNNSQPVKYSACPCTFTRLLPSFPQLISSNSKRGQQQV